jgi:bacteriocin biosynthesis cyclodehydratase domain-containing protein
VIRQLPDYPLIKRHLLITTVGPDELFLLAEDRVWLWKSSGMAHLLPFLDGSRTLGDLFELASPQITPPEVMYLLQLLLDYGLLAEGIGAPPLDAKDPELAFWHAAGAGEDDVSSRVRGARVRVRAAAPDVDTAALADALRIAGVTVIGDADGDDRAPAALDVVLTDHYFRPELARINAAALKSGTPWMVCKLAGTMPWIGPVFQPAATGCMACLENRLRLNRQVEDFVVRKTGDADYYRTAIGVSRSAMRLAAAWAAQEIVMWLAGRTERLQGKILTVTFGRTGPEVATHVLVRRAQCPACGDPRAAVPALPETLRAPSLAASAGNGGRLQSAEATLARLRHHVSAITGVVTWLVDLANDPEDLVHCYNAGHNFALGPDTLNWLRQSLRSRTGGKGATSAQAQVSAVCEAIERYCGVFRDDVPRIRAMYRELGASAVHPERCLNFSDEQYAQRDALNAADREGFFHLVPRRFPEDLEIDWAPLWSLTAGETRYVPAALCYYGHPDVGKEFYCTGDANGCAAGSVIEEAILHAFLELVERDSAAIWWYNRIARPALDLDSFPDPYLARVRERYARHDRELWALDITADLGIPVIAAVSRRIGGPADDLLIGFGAHLDPATALHRAITEVNQFLPAVSQRHADGRTRYVWPDDVAVRFWQNETLATQPQLVPDSAAPPRTLAQFSNLAGANPYDDLATCVRIARGHGLEVLALDQSRPDIELAVARVVVPGLRHFWRRLGPGRLYDVPVQLGWLASPTAEEDLNPTSIFF